MKKKTLLFSTLSLLPLAAVVAIGAQSAKPFSALGDIDQTWMHYSAKAAGLDTRGCKEYWVNCTTHQHQFTAPETDATNITEAGTLSDGLLYALAKGDDRVIEPILDSYEIDFENASDADQVYSLRNNFATKEIVDSELDGNKSKALKVTFNDGTADFALKDEYIDAVFADSRIAGIDFDVASNRKFDLQGYDGSKQVRYEGNGHDMYCTRANYFKTCTWTRAMYENYKTVGNRSKALIWTVITAGTEWIMIDNIRPTTVVSCKTPGCFEGGGVHDDTVSNISFRLYNGGNAEQFVLSGGTQFELSSEYSTEGKKSGKIRGSTISMVINNNLKNSMTDTQVMLFDFMMKPVDPADFTGFGNGNGNNQSCGNTIDWGSPFYTNQWFTFGVTKAQIATNQQPIRIGAGSRVLDFYFDNLRVVELPQDEDFETASVLTKTVNADYIFGGYHPAGSTLKLGLRAFSTDNKAILDARVTSDMHSDGSKSAMITKKGGYISFHISSDIKSTLESFGYTLTFDLYTTMDLVTADSTGTLMNGVNKAFSHAHTAGQWQTYTLTANDITADGRFLIITGSSSGNIFIDNFTLAE